MGLSARVRVRARVTSRVRVGLQLSDCILSTIFWVRVTNLLSHDII